MTGPRTRVAGLVCLVAMGCSEPTLQVRLAVPPEFRDLVVAASLQIFEPPPQGPFDCDQIAFAEVAEETLRLSRRQEVVVGAGELVDLSGIDRTAAKVLVAHGLDRDQVPVVSSCASLGSVEGEAEISLAAEPQTLLLLPEDETIYLNQQDPLPGEVTVTVTDIRDRALGGIELHWDVVGPGGVRPGDPVPTDASGQATLYPDPSDLPGPSVLDVRARWQQNDVAPVRGFEAPPVLLEISVPGLATSYVVGRLGPGGEIGFAVSALVQAAPSNGTRVHIYAYDSGSHDFVTTDPAGFFVSGLAILALRVGSSTDTLIAVSEVSWTHLDFNDVLSETSFVLPTPGDLLQNVREVGPCESLLGRQVLAVTTTDGGFGLYDADGRPATSAFSTLTPPIYMYMSGCAADVTGGVHRAIYYTDGDEPMVSADMDRLRTGQAPAIIYAAAPPVGSERPGLMGLDLRLLTGATVSFFDLEPYGDTSMQLRPTRADAVFDYPNSLAGGDVDKDDTRDLVALISGSNLLSQTPDGPPTTVVAMVLGASHRGERPFGLSMLPDAYAPAVFLADFDLDGHDDLLVGEFTSDPAVAVNRVWVYPMGP